MGYRYAVLGAGRQGFAAAYDLAKFGDADEVRLLDVRHEAAQAGADRLNRVFGRMVVRPAAVDAMDEAAVATQTAGIDAIVGAVHYTFNRSVTRLAIAHRLHAVDLGGNTDVVRQQLEMDCDARSAGVTVVPDCGMGPGLNVSLATYVMSLVERPREVLIWDGGLPQSPEPPWNYLCAFNLAGLTNEYDGNAFFLRNGRITTVPAFSGYEEIEFPAPVGKLEAFVTSGGLSTAPWTLEGRLERLENKTLRYPGHLAQFKAFADLGLLGQDPIDIGGTRVVPRDVLHALLATRIQQPGDFKDLCVMRVTCRGTTGGRPAEATVDVIDRYDDSTGLTAMQRLTGWHAAIMLIAAVKGRIRRGVVPVEQALAGGAVVEAVRRRGIQVSETVTAIDA